MGKYSADSTRHFTEKNRRHSSICIYCFESADTREHIPSKIFIDTPYPNNFAIVPACRKCNGDFSADELYASCFIDAFRNISSNKQTPLRKKTLDALEYNNKLAEAIDKSFEISTTNFIVTYDAAKIKSVIVKLARGHIVNKLDYLIDPSFDTLHFAMKFAPDLTIEEVSDFNALPIIEKTGEVGADFVHDLFVFHHILTGEEKVFLPWQIFQESTYRFLAFPSGHEQLTVRIVIFETLFAELIYSLG